MIFTIVKLNGAKDNTVSDPKIKGIMYKIKNRLFKYFSIIN